jgi:chromosome segregation protein
MRLKKLVLHGFKSFADRTEFVFDSPITGIVGPNGCGKSNVVDAFKWVLGEQSAKSLRGEAMLDVIFNGSGSRKPAGMSEVTLVFENPYRADGSRMLNIDTDEVSVGRRLFRDATSEYQINKQTARLKDIRELFLDTGIGVDAYSVIEQGKVDLLLQANPQERRLIFEEAAGISKYKAKKKESQRKLEKVDQNLLRLGDIVEEVEKRLRSVKVQAGRARTYQEHSQRLRELRLMYAVQEYHTHHQNLTELTAKREDAQFRLDDAAAELARRQNLLAEKREQLEVLSQKKQQIEYELVQTQAAIQSAKQQQQYANQQLEQMAEQLAGFEQDRAAGEQKAGEVEQALAAETEALAGLTEQLEAHRRQIEQRQQAFRDGQLQLNQLNQQVEQHKSAVLDLMRKLAQANSRLGAIEIERKNIANQQSRLGERRRVVIEELEGLEKQREELQVKLDEAVARIAEQQQHVEARRAEAAALGKQIAEVTEQLGAAREHRSGLMSRQKLLQDLEAKREGVSEAVKAVLRQREERYPFVRGLVADLLSVDVEHAHVIEAALDGRDQWLVADSAEAALAADFEELEGRINICGTGCPPVQHGLTAHATDEPYDWNRHEHRVRLAVDLVKFQPADAGIAGQLLGRTVVVDDLRVAEEVHRTGPQGWRYVTHAGEVLEADGTLRTGPLSEAMGLLSRRSELEALGQQIAEVDRRIEHLTREVAEGNAQARALEEQLNALRNEIYQTNTVKVELTSQVAQNNDKQGSLRREQPLLDKELQQLMDQNGRLTSEEQALAEKRGQLEADQASHQQQIESQTADQQRLAEELKQWSEELTSARVTLGQVQEKQLASRQAVQRQTAMKQELAQQLERIARSIEAVGQRRKGVEAELVHAQRAEQQQLEKHQGLAEQVQSVAAKVQEHQQAVQALTGEVESIRGEHAELEHSLHQLDVQLGELRVRLETLVQRTRDELELDVPARYEEMSGVEGGYQPEDLDWDAVAAEIKELRDKIQRLGNVNIDAIGEQEELEQRQEFLSTQILDLTTSKQQLEELIDTINRESSIRFEQTFTAVREHFQGMFRKLFGGGKADIYLETEVVVKDEIGNEVLKQIDILDAGIEVTAQPPGKKPVSISQLSGGEKTMTCVALLMSIFKSKPSPFCILDEVDAALDEANNQRFNLIVQEFLEQSQFIIVTHSKRTMQIADVLYGVTMQEQGVSKRVAVKFDQVDGQGRIAEHAAA